MTEPYRDAQPHGPIREVFPNVFVVTGDHRMQRGVTIPRNMIIVRVGSELILVNSIRLSPAGEAALEALGKPAHLLCIGPAHGVDDAWTVNRFKLARWVVPGASDRGLPVDHALTTDATLPIPGATLFAFETTLPDSPERALVLPQNDGILVTCDSVQNWTPATLAACSFGARLILRLNGFGGPAQIGVFWRKRQNVARSDFQRLLALPFRHLLAGHGEALLNSAHADLAADVARVYPSV